MRNATLAARVAVLEAWREESEKLLGEIGAAYLREVRMWQRIDNLERSNRAMADRLKGQKD